MKSFKLYIIAFCFAFGPVHNVIAVEPDITLLPMVRSAIVPPNPFTVLLYSAVLPDNNLLQAMKPLDVKSNTYWPTAISAIVKKQSSPQGMGKQRVQSHRGVTTAKPPKIFTQKRMRGKGGRDQRNCERP